MINDISTKRMKSSPSHTDTQDSANIHQRYFRY